VRRRREAHYIYISELEVAAAAARVSRYFAKDKFSSLALFCRELSIEMGDSGLLLGYLAASSASSLAAASAASAARARDCRAANKPEPQTRV